VRLKSLKHLIKMATFGLFALVCLLVAGNLSCKKAMAFSTTTPIQSIAPATNSANITGSGASIQPWFAVGEGAYDGTFSYAKIYVPAGGAATLTVSQGNGICGIDVGSPSVQYEVYTLNTSENLGGAGSTRIGIKNNSGGCGALTFNLAGGAPSNRVGHGSYDVYYFQATIVGPGVGDNEKNFRLSVSNGLIGVSRPVANLGTKPWFGIYMRDAPNRGGNNWDYAVQSAPYCNEDAGATSKSIAVHDIDWQVYNQPNLEGLVDKDDRSAAGFNWSLTPPGRPSSDKLQGDWPTGNNTNANLTFSYNDTYRYLLEFRDIDWHNTIQISLPFDEFDAQAKVGQACNSSPGPIVSCSASPLSQPVPQNSTGKINIAGTISGSGGSWKGTYFIKRTGPTSRSFAAGQTATDSVIYTGNTPVTYTYVVWDSASNSQVSSGNCQAQINWTPPNGGGTVYCTATPSSTQVPLNSPATVDITVYNNSSINLQGNQVRQKASDSANTGAVWPASGFGNFTNGQQAAHTFPVSARSTAKVVTFRYDLYKGTQAGDPPVTGSGVQTPLCSATITWGNPPQGFTISCSQTTIPSMTSTANYQHATTTTTTPPSYITAVNPNQWGSYPYPPGPPKATPLQIINGTINVNIWSYQPSPQSTTTYTTLPATEVPYYIHFDGSDGSSQDSAQQVAPGNPSSPQANPTFGTYQFLRPDLTYTATLYAQLSGSLGNEQAGPYGSWTPVGQPQPLKQCLTAGACIGGNSPTGTPGQTVQSTYRISITNNTDRGFDSGFGYNLLAHPDGAGLVAAGNMSQAVAVPTGQQTLSGTFTFITNYQGTYWVEFRYQGTTVGTPDNNFSGTCGSGSDTVPPVTITPAVAPYFQVWNGDSAGGGGFRTVDYQCPTTYPDYVSPPTAKAAGRGSADYYGGIRAMSSDTIQSRADFGAVAMGLIPNSVGQGFFVRNSAYFANTGLPSGLGGYLNTNSANHCVDDYYTNTQVDPGSTTPLGDLQNDINNCPLDTDANSYRCQFQTTSTIIGGITVARGHQITLYVDGDVTLDGNITYQEPFDPNSRADVPYFAIVAKGNITLTNNVTRLDGLYVAQPSNGSAGRFSTCGEGAFCNRQLVVNGAVVAQHVLLLRGHGSSQPLGSDVNGISTNPGEVINFVPSMIIGAPMFNPQPNGPEGYFSLPPVF
jgi:hypothetical protein